MKRSENAPEMQEWFSGIFQAAKEETVAYKGETLITNISHQNTIPFYFLCFKNIKEIQINKAEIILEVFSERPRVTIK